MQDVLIIGGVLFILLLGLRTCMAPRSGGPQPTRGVKG